DGYTARDPEDEARHVAEAMEYLPAEWRDDYEKWLLVGLCLRQLGRTGLELWRGWSRGAKYQFGDCGAKWGTMAADRSAGVHLGIVSAGGRGTGWRRPWPREPWPPLRLAEPPRVRPFPVQVLPPPLRRYCREVAAATLAPVDLVGSTMLAVAGAAIGQSVQV